MKPDTSELSHAKGDRTELGLAEELKTFYSGKEVVVLLGPTFRKPGGQLGHNQEHDVVIVDRALKVVIGIESKTFLNDKICHSVVEQTERLRKLVEEYFSEELVSGEWRFVPLVYYHTIKTKSKLPICPDCAPFTIQGPGKVAAKLATMEAHQGEPQPPGVPRPGAGHGVRGAGPAPLHHLYRHQGGLRQGGRQG